MLREIRDHVFFMDFFARKLQDWGLCETAVSAIVAVMKPARTIRVGGIIRTRGSQSSFTHVMVDGWAARCEDVALGDRQITNFLLPGDFCDLHQEAIGPIDHDIVALTPASVASIPSDELVRLEREHPDIARATWRAALTESAIFRAWIANVGQRESDARIAHLLCELHVRLELAGLVGDHTFQMPLTQQELSQALGITAIHMNRMVQRLRAMKLIHLEHRMLSLLDVERLRALAGFEPDYLHLCAS